MCVWINLALVELWYFCDCLLWSVLTCHVHHMYTLHRHLTWGEGGFPPPTLYLVQAVDSWCHLHACHDGNSFTIFRVVFDVIDALVNGLLLAVVLQHSP